MRRRAAPSIVSLVAALVIGLGAGAACSKQAAEPGPEPGDDRPPPIPTTEVQRGQDACAAYVAKVCACEAPEAKPQCELARALPDAMQVGLEVAASPDSDRRTVLHAHDSVRKTIKQCIEQTARLPQLGCP